MLEDVAAYLIFAPLAASLVVGVVAAVWYAANRPAKAHVLGQDGPLPPDLTAT